MYKKYFLKNNLRLAFLLTFCAMSKSKPPERAGKNIYNYLLFGQTRAGGIYAQRSCYHRL